ncbi:AlpA family transcriptional regulator [Pseudomonas sp. DTU_2021_1001937_2_SI_NGA_ILE_001]|uniref:helix-turn-helix transcriptional regulator n=1 Tax=Pseudomonas sp. DTU_2021_1001937_2_SI_NGA_ILE_001 TaxID=3077589 RepID=UPI0028FC146D|nr:AlpA family transcriptional regulator [Pseudomonas sp. DTU_2021_1001937_2_SI_NGA_ILE_001]WNW10088.1 AlpA family transcriptional regulator [Pseudomonas sp. DTU_2021_1001937_2_SI_NGA_ILE_001]
MNTETTITEIEFIKLPEVKKLTGLGTTKIYQMANDGLFPAQVKLGERSVAWIKSEVLEWNRDRVTQARGHSHQQSEQLAS